MRSFDNFDGLNRADQVGAVVSVKEDDSRSVVSRVVDGRVFRTDTRDERHLRVSYREMTNPPLPILSEPTPSPLRPSSEYPTLHSIPRPDRRSSWSSQTNNPTLPPPEAQECRGM